MGDVLERVAALIAERIAAGEAERSYVAALHRRGLDAILKKVGEEATEAILAAKGEDRQRLVAETADLWFHTLVMLAARGLGPAEVLAELERRIGTSGLEEKAARRPDFG